MKKNFITLAFIVSTYGTAVADSHVENWLDNDIGLSANCPSGDTPFTCTSSKNYVTWSSGSSCTTIPNSCYTVSSNVLNYHGVALPIVSSVSYGTTNQYISLEAKINANCGPDASSQCFSGLTLYNGEQNYREIAYRNGSTNMEIHRVTNCQDEILYNGSTGVPLTVTRGSTHKLRLDYYGQDGGKWVYFVDDIVQWIDSSGVSVEPPYQEPASQTLNYPYCTNPSVTDPVALSAAPRTGLFFVGLDSSSYVTGGVQPVSVYWGDYADQSQLTQSDGFGATSSAWAAQYVLMGSNVQNITKVRLFLINGQSYNISAYLNNNGVPGALINSALYTSDRYGLQDVPLWVPSPYAGFWIVIKGTSSSQTSTIGVTLSGSKPYDQSFLYTWDSGVSWSVQNRSLTFSTYTRR